MHHDLSNPPPHFRWISVANGCGMLLIIVLTRYIEIPLLPKSLLLAIPMSVYVWLIISLIRLDFRQLRRHDLNLCLTCGYDLRAHKSGDKCPECGTPIPPPSR